MIYTMNSAVQWVQSRCEWENHDEPSHDISHYMSIFAIRHLQIGNGIPSYPNNLVQSPHFSDKKLHTYWVVPCIFPRFHGVHIIFKTMREHIVIFREVPHVSPWIHQGRFCGPSQRRGAHGERRVLQRCAESRTVQFSHQHRQWLGWDGLTYAPDSLAVCGCCIEMETIQILELSFWELKASEGGACPSNNLRHLGTPPKTNNVSQKQLFSPSSWQSPPTVWCDWDR